MLVEPELAAVKPRVVSRYTGHAIPIEEAIGEAAAEGIPGRIWLIGPPGAGKTTALRHLAAALPAAYRVQFLDDVDPSAAQVEDALIICTTSQDVPGQRSYRLAPWSDDEVLEYVLARHPDQCTAIMTRLKWATDRPRARGNPELWRIAIDQMACDDSSHDIASAWRKFVETSLADLKAHESFQLFCLRLLQRRHEFAKEAEEALKVRGINESLLRMARHEAVQVVLVADFCAIRLAGEAPCSLLRTILPRELVREVARMAKGQPRCLARLKELAAGPERASISMASSVLLAIDPSWVPAQGFHSVFDGAYLDHAHWPGINLSGASLKQTDLSYANLEGACLDRAQALEADMSFAVLRGASLQAIDAAGANASGVDFSHTIAERAGFVGACLRACNFQGANLWRANLARADLTEANFIRANLRKAGLRGATIDAANFSGADLHGARLSGLALGKATFTLARLASTDLRGCNLENMQLEKAQFQAADLTEALLTGSTMPEANFSGACLRHAGLADIDWEGADLRRANLEQASFHMGSSRSGRVGSPVACEGSRTGFYTDEYLEQDFKSPEEIRTANLRGADLRGAKIGGCDFYLVDLRDAQYDAGQKEHFRRCGAILAARASG